MGIEQLFGEFPTFETNRLLLRKFSMMDAEDYYQISSDPIVTSQTTWERHTSKEDSIKYIQKVLDKYKRHEGFHWGIVYKSSGQLIGRTGLIRIDPIHNKAELGYVLSKDYWNQGIITEATSQIVKYGFSELGLNRIEAQCNVNNPGSYRVMEKLGLVMEGVLRKQLKIKGEYLDQRMYSILRSDFESEFEEQERLI